MIYAFDIDGTLTHAPRTFASMMVALKKDGHGVIVVTGAIKGIEITMEQRTQQLARLDIYEKVHYDNIYICVGADMKEVAQGKGNVCHALSVDMLFEDNEDFIRFVRAISPGTATMMVKT